MQNIMDYLEWRGDLRFEQDGFNEVDNLILSALAYLEYDSIVPPKYSPHSISLSEIATGFKEQIDKFSTLDHNPFFKQIPGLLYAAAQTPRYRDIRLSHYVNEIDDRNAEQFSAVIFSINDHRHFMAFRGTDDTITGWKEDFQMSFKDEVPAQKQAVIYMNAVFPQLAGDFYMGGHSKGGNLAVYAAAHADRNTLDRIISVYNNDGPGFQTPVLQSEGYQNILYKIHTLMPKSSVVGMLLGHSGSYEVISSRKMGIMQHDAFSWEVKGTSFVHAPGLAKSSLTLKQTVRAWMEKLSPKQKEQVVNAIFDVIQATGAKTVAELSKERLGLSKSMISTFTHLDRQTRLHLWEITLMMFHEGNKTVRKSIVTEWKKYRQNKGPLQEPAIS